jgi:hypothetical protein
MVLDQSSRRGAERSSGFASPTHYAGCLLMIQQTPPIYIPLSGKVCLPQVGEIRRVRERYGCLLGMAEAQYPPAISSKARRSRAVIGRGSSPLRPHLSQERSGWDRPSRRTLPGVGCTSRTPSLRAVLGRLMRWQYRVKCNPSR